MMICLSCGRVMEEDKDYIFTVSDPGWREKKGLMFYCDNHVYNTCICVECNNEIIKYMLRFSNYFIQKLLLFFLNYEYVEGSVIKRKWKR